MHKADGSHRLFFEMALMETDLERDFRLTHFVIATLAKVGGKQSPAIVLKERALEIASLRSQ